MKTYIYCPECGTLNSPKLGEWEKNFIIHRDIDYVFRCKGCKRTFIMYVDLVETEIEEDE